MEHEAGKLIESSVQDPEEELWEAFSSWHLINWGWCPSKAQRAVQQTHAWTLWIAYKAGAEGCQADQYAVNPRTVTLFQRNQDPITYLIDQFAMAALPAIQTASNPASAIVDYDDVAYRAYTMATAMMHRREKVLAVKKNLASFFPIKSDPLKGDS